MAQIALYHPWIYLMGGAEKTILELVKRSKHTWTIYTNHFEPENTFPEFKNLNVIELTKIPVKRDFFNITKAFLVIVFQKVKFSGDLVLISSEGFGDLMNFKVNKKKPIICFCHTPLKVIYDSFSRKRYIKLNGKSAVYKLAIAGFFFKQIEKRAWKRYSRVICNSNEVKKRVLDAGLSSKEIVSIAHPGVDLKRYTNLNITAGEYFLIPGRMMWTKNIEMGIEAYKISRAKEKHVKLIVAGVVDKKSEEYFRKLKALAQGDSMIKFVVSPNDETLLRLYQDCMAVIFTPPNEDWGIVPVEAMAAGKPVIAVNNGGPKESIINNVTGYLTDNNKFAFSQAMNKVLANKNLNNMCLEARKNAQKYSWDRFVEKIDNKIDEVLG
ncbi:glycosyltransferase [Sporolactobacillus putidus]|uniref:GDP-Man:Man(1)GlcNAc(2)-PP-Dol alpha-1,3-mannosyltransferase n=1 Tax=Sporolactobacillus putidus TaxID=492735 RepID=A0A917S629_9BACL|nr:glycosyltransferase [Sporolactobacillus putidus]GGL57244.1 mannosyltransferase [Sporolactobacillus putidus]